MFFDDSPTGPDESSDESTEEREDHEFDIGETDTEGDPAMEQAARDFDDSIGTQSHEDEVNDARS